MKKTAIITGANGFIGQHLSKRLIKNGYNVYAFGRDILYDQNKLKEQIDIVSPTHIFNLAAYGNHRQQDDDDTTITANYMLTYFLLRNSLQAPYSLFVQFGSSSEYGVKANPMSEHDRLCPTTIYGATKAASSLLSLAFEKKYNKPIVVVRPFSVYGEGEADFRFIPTVIRSLINGDEMVVDKEANHDWIYIDDFIDGIMTVIDMQEKEKTVSGTIVNIGTGKQTKNKDIIKTLENISTKRLLYKESTNLRVGDSSNWVADISFLKYLGWKENTGLVKGLKRTYKYYKKIYEQ